MSYFVFLNNFDNIDGSLYRIAENKSDLDNLNIIQTNYKIIEDSQSNFNLVKYGNKDAVKYNDNTIIYLDTNINFNNKQSLNNYVLSFKNEIKQFLNNNINHPLYNRWDSYYNQLNNLNLDNITYPLNKSLEQYFDDLGQPSLNPLQLP